MCIKTTVTPFPFLLFTATAVGYPHKTMRSPQLSTTYPQLGGKECQSGHFTLLVLLPRLLLNSGGEFIDLVIDRTTLSHQLTDFAVGVHNRGVITPAECLADFWKREFG